MTFELVGDPHKPQDPKALPVIIARAQRKLAEARTSAEVLEARKMAEAAYHFARILKAAHDTQGELLLLIHQTEIRMADEIDAAQERGELERPGGNRKTIIPQASGNDPATLDDIGVDSRRLAEWRQTRDAGEQVVREAIGAALDQGRAPTMGDIRRAVKQAVLGHLPSPAEAREIAREHGSGFVLGSDGKLHTHITPEGQARADAWYAFKVPVWALATLAISPADAVASVPHYQREHVTQNLDAALAFLTEFKREWNKA